MDDNTRICGLKDKLSDLMRGINYARQAHRCLENKKDFHKVFNEVEVVSRTVENWLINYLKEYAESKEADDGINKSQHIKNFVEYKKMRLGLMESEADYLIKKLTE